MKRILLLAILLISTVSVFAQKGATLRVRLSTNQKLSLAIDDRYYEKRGNSLTVGNIPAGKHYLKVYSLRVGQRSARGRANLVYSGYVVLKPNSFNAAVVDPMQRKLSMRTTTTYDRPGNDDVYQNWNDRHDDHYNDQYDDRYNDRDDRWNDRYNDNGNVMKNEDVTDLGARVKDRITDSDKQQLMQSVLSNRTYYTDQLRTMIGWLGFESTKLEFAKWAYDNAIDKENYWKLEDVFSFSSSKNDLNEYIQGRPGNNNNTYNYRDDRRGDRGRGRSDYNNRAMSNQDISDLGIRVKDRMGDSDKLTLVQSVLQNNEYNTDQVRTVLGWFSFESTKLEFAKWAYDRTIDRENYWKLEDVFSFSSSKTELSQHIQGRN